MYLFFDTETTGLNRRSDRIVQLAWILTDQFGREISREDNIIKPEGFSIPPQASKIHGISTALASEVGKELSEVLNRFCKAFSKAEYAIAHNINFDLPIIKEECGRIGLQIDDARIGRICTMRLSTHWCRLPKYNGSQGYKWPTLQELHSRLFGSDFDGAHNALADVIATKRCFFELVNKKIIVIDQDTHSHIDECIAPNNPKDADKLEGHIFTLRRAPTLLDGSSLGLIIQSKDSEASHGNDSSDTRELNGGGIFEYVGSSNFYAKTPMSLAWTRVWEDFAQYLNKENTHKIFDDQSLRSITQEDYASIFRHVKPNEAYNWAIMKLVGEMVVECAPVGDGKYYGFMGDLAAFMALFRISFGFAPGFARILGEDAAIVAFHMSERVRALVVDIIEKKIGDEARPWINGFSATFLDYGEYLEDEGVFATLGSEDAD